MKTIKTVLFAVLLSLLPQLATANPPTETTVQKAVLVTGSNSGLGLKMTEQLSKNGFHVYAGVLHKKDMAAMNSMDNVTAVQFDVRNQREINAAVKFVQKQGRGLYGLINNAGVSVFGPMLEMPVEQLKYQMDVNVYGPFRVTQAFAPMIMQSKGRIATTGSIAGILSSPMFGAYSMSKHAIEAHTDALAQEMARFGVSVHVIEPGNYASNIGNAAKRLILEEKYWPEDTLYSAERTMVLERTGQAEHGPDPTDVGMAALDIMQSESPRRRYMVTATAGAAERTIRRQLSKLLELNTGQAHELDRAGILRLLDEEIAKNAAQ